MNTVKGAALGFTVGLLVLGRYKFSRFSALGAGVGGGIALNNCGHEFNKIQARE